MSACRARLRSVGLCRREGGAGVGQQWHAGYGCVGCQSGCSPQSIRDSGEEVAQLCPASLWTLWGAVGVSAWVQAETRVQELCPGLQVAEKSWLLSLLGN